MPIGFSLADINAANQQNNGFTTPNFSLASMNAANNPNPPQFGPKPDNSGNTAPPGSWGAYTPTANQWTTNGVNFLRSPSTNYNADGTAMTYAQSLADNSGQQQLRDNNQSDMWNILNGRWRTANEPTTGAITPQANPGFSLSSINNSINNGGAIPSTSAAPSSSANVPDFSMNSMNRANAPTPVTGSQSGRTSSGNFDAAVQNFLAHSSPQATALAGKTPQEFLAGLRNVTAGDIAGMDAQTRALAQDAFNAAGLAMPGTGGLPNPNNTNGNNTNNAGSIFEEGRLYTDANGNRAYYRNGQWVPA